ncbi:MAG: hypothetical protein KIC66_15910 [Clostridium sp.]|nr:hypothetical protein [Clostridium sp.]MBS5987959.1 hypothetical protein [Clostridium sp.]
MTLSSNILKTFLSPSFSSISFLFSIANIKFLLAYPLRAISNLLILLSSSPFKPTTSLY